jgi:fluoride exporter
MTEMPALLLLIAVGGAAGSYARYRVATAVYARTGIDFPWGTLAVNVIGSFLLGGVVTGVEASPFRMQLAALLAVGFLGDFTTFSSFAYESATLVRDRQWRRAMAYQAGSTMAALAAVALGMAAGAAWVG